jgi:hypothetical protein
MFERYLLVKGVNHVNVPRGEHHSIRVAEKVIQDLNNMMSCMLSDSNVPNIYWDFVIEHVVLVNSMITPSISDKTETIFELQYCKLACLLQLALHQGSLITGHHTVFICCVLQ